MSRCAVVLFVWASLLCLAGIASAQPAGQSALPNILWLTVEDTGPELGCYGNPDAVTPHLDRFARESTRYLNAWSNAPVCAPARTTLVTGLYPHSTGSEHMRSLTRIPTRFEMYPAQIRKAGYFCFNQSKEDYNVERPEDLWDEIAEKRRPWSELKKHQPFIAVLNQNITHESRIRTRPHQQVHDPAKVSIPPYHPDTPDVRQDWAQDYDNITEMDEWFGRMLEQLESNGLDENTIVFFYGDHGSGMPRHKRAPYASGLRVPLLIRVPEKFRHLASADMQPGGTSERLVAFIDFAPTLVSLAGQKPPAWMQGRAFMGAAQTEPNDYLYSFQGRMSERYDLIRTVRNKRYLYVRNYMPHRPLGQQVNYMFQTPSTRSWYEEYRAGRLNPVQSRFWERKSPDELYDLEQDPHQIDNRIDDPALKSVRDELRHALRQQQLTVRDVGLIPEQELRNLLPEITPYEFGHDPERYPLERVLEMADRATFSREADLPVLVQGLKDENSVVRYWAAMGLLIQGEKGFEAGGSALHEVVLHDPSPSVRVPAAELLARFGNSEQNRLALQWLLEAADGSTFGAALALQALTAIDELDEKARPIAEALQKVVTDGPWRPERDSTNIELVRKKAVEDLSAVKAF
ncbi:sulfatase-like hydrolase/transferase [Planctomicrobium sp. SH664]|uniref:sulfatase-like hydrolase/transferase n=1 Tax=Planctomicrobium sp. SH664 TaxID=3448125 RepID=UPI003F5B1722